MGTPIQVCARTADPATKDRGLLKTEADQCQRGGVSPVACDADVGGSLKVFPRLGRGETGANPGEVGGEQMALAMVPLSDNIHGILYDTATTMGVGFALHHASAGGSGTRGP
jgi:hypothetical protein